MPCGLPEHFVVLSVTGIWFMLKIFPKSAFLTFRTFASERNANIKKSQLCSEVRPCKLFSLLQQHLSPPGSTTGLPFCHYSPHHTETFASIYRSSSYSYFEQHPLPLYIPRALITWMICCQQRFFLHLCSLPHRCRTFPLLFVQMGYGLPCDLRVWRRRIHRRPCYPPMSNPSTSLWNAWPNGSGRWDNRMAAQNLLRDLVRKSSG